MIVDFATRLKNNDLRFYNRDLNTTLQSKPSKIKVVK